MPLESQTLGGADRETATASIKIGHELGALTRSLQVSEILDDSIANEVLQQVGRR